MTARVLALWLVAAVLNCAAQAPRPTPVPGTNPPGTYPPGTRPPGRSPTGTPGTYPPGTYPPGTYPPGGVPGVGSGIPMPSKGSKKPKGNLENEATRIVEGLLRELKPPRLVLETDDRRLIRYRVSDKTEYLRETKPIDPAKLEPADRIYVQYGEDEQGTYFATQVIFLRHGSQEERASAPHPDNMPLPDLDLKKSEDERPKLTRGGKKKQEEPEAREAETATGGTGAPKPAPEESAEPLRNEPTTVVRESAPAPPDGEGPPKLKRGVPERIKRGQEQQRAGLGGAPETAPPAEPASTTAAPISVAPAGTAAPVQREGALLVTTGGLREEPPIAVDEPPDPFLEQAKEINGDFQSSLPNYLVQQLTTRYVSDTPRVSFRAQDLVGADVVFENGQERYTNVTLNGKKTGKTFHELGGTWSSGEFGTVLADIFSKSTAATFRYQIVENLNGREASRYRFWVPQERSHWTLHFGSQTYRPAYRGSVWIDRETKRVLRVEMEARSLPQDFPMDTAETTVDYDFVRLGGMQKFLVPVSSDNLSCVRGRTYCMKNHIEFRNYRKFGAESQLDVGDVVDGGKDKTNPAAAPKPSSGPKQPASRKR